VVSQGSGIIRPAITSGDIEHVAGLAHRIWTEHYTPIIGSAQVEYMLERFQSAVAIARQIHEGHQYFLLYPHADVSTDIANATPAAYLDVVSQFDLGKLFLSKLYVAQEARGRGFGRQLFEYSRELARQQHLSTLYLTVNKFNPTLHIYLQWGMVNVGPVVRDIGNGFVMDDYQLEMACDSDPQPVED